GAVGARGGGRGRGAGAGKLALFRDKGGRPDIALGVLFVAVNGLVLANAIRHDPAVGYDANAHLRYITVLATARLPDPRDTYEFFTPPLPYVVPAAVVAAGPSVPAPLQLAQLPHLAWS